MNPGEQIDVTVLPTSEADALAFGEYADTVVFSDTTNGTATTRDVSLFVIPPVLASQDFGVANFPSDMGFNADGEVTHPSTGATDLGFRASGKPSTGAGFGVYGKKFNIGHMSSSSGRVATETADPVYGVTFMNYATPENTRTAYLLSDTVDLGGYAARTFSMSIADLDGATNTGDDAIVVRLYLNGSTTGTTILDSREDDGEHNNGAVDAADVRAGATYVGSTLSYTFADTDTSAALYVAAMVDDTEDGYYIDDIRFQGAPDHDGDGIPDDSDPDDDNDGIPDDWESAHSLDPFVDDRAGDPDGDGYDNWFEFVADTDPHDANSKQTLSVSLAPGTGQPNVRFGTANSRSYVVEFSDDLAPASWVDLTLPLAGTGSERSVPDPAIPSRRFYRLRITVIP